MSTVYLVKRGPRAPHHRAPFHPVIICGKRRVAKWEAEWTGEQAWVWSHERGTRGGGWLLERWNGFDVDYGHVVRLVTMPDGTEAGFAHEHTGREPWPLLAGAVWWDDRKMPGWLADAGVVYAPDAFSQQRILDAVAGDGSSGFGRPTPDFWPTPAALQRWEVTDGPRIPNGAVVQFEEGIGCYAKPAQATVVALIATLEPPNGRYMDEYRLRFEDERETRRYRDLLERQNPTALAGSPVPGEVSDAES